MGSVAVYIDGYNVYRSLKRWRSESRGECLYWLDYWALCSRLVQQHPLARPDDVLVAVNYYSALPEKSPDRRSRHESFIEANEWRARKAGARLNTVLGSFQIIPNGSGCNKCGSTWDSRMEKQTDTALCSDLIDHAHDGIWDCVIVMSSDSDMAPAMRLIKEKPTFAGRRVILAYPPRIKTDGANFHLENASHAKMKTTSLIRACQMPNPVSRPGGPPIPMPPTWV